MQTGGWWFGGPKYSHNVQPQKSLLASQPGSPEGFPLLHKGGMHTYSLAVRLVNPPCCPFQSHPAPEGHIEKVLYSKEVCSNPQNMQQMAQGVSLKMTFFFCSGFLFVRLSTNHNPLHILQVQVAAYVSPYSLRWGLSKIVNYNYNPELPPHRLQSTTQTTTIVS